MNLLAGKWNHTINVEEGILEAEAANLLRELFKNKRESAEI